MKKLFLSVLLIVFVYSVKAQSDDKSAQPGYHEHDGFYLSMSIGPVFGTTTDKMDGGNVDFSGTGAQFDFKIGGRISENIILHATLLSNAVTGPTIKTPLGSAKAPNNVSFNEAMLGGGFTYYFMPSNFFFSGSVGLGNFSLVDSKSDLNISTERGFSMQLKLGKEWWISKNWGFGVGLTYGKTNLTTNTDGIKEKFDSNRFGILFNTTFN